MNAKCRRMENLGLVVVDYLQLMSSSGGKSYAGEKADHCADRSMADLCSFINERWKGMYPVAWGDTTSETQFTSWLYNGVAGLDEWLKEHEPQKNVNGEIKYTL